MVRLNSSGAVVKTYTHTGGSELFALNLDGTSFWTADSNTGEIFHFDIASGTQLGTFSIGRALGGMSLFGERCAAGCGGGGGGKGNIFETTFKRCNTLHVGYNRFTDGTVVNWSVTTNGVVTVASGHFTVIGGGRLGSKTYHFMDIPLGTTLPSEASGIQSHMHFHGANGGSYAATRDSGC